jgi:hypothetical protein
MPFKSRAQERWAHTPEGMKALGGPSKVAEWEAATKGNLPKYVKGSRRDPMEMLKRGIQGKKR